MLTVPPTKASLLRATPAGMDLDIQVHARRLLLSAVPWISEDRLLILFHAAQPNFNFFRVRVRQSVQNGGATQLNITIDTLNIVWTHR